MKRLLYLIMSIVIVSGVFAGCSKKTFTIGGLMMDFTNIEVSDGRNGNSITLDKEQSDELYEAIKDIEFTKEASSKDNTEESYSLNFLNNKNEIEDIIVISEETIAYEGYLYKDETSSIDMKYLASFFGVTFQAVVIEKNDDMIVTPDRDSNEFKSSDKIAVGTKDATIFDMDNKEISLEELEVGDVIKITYNGAIRESYPAQIDSNMIIKMEPSTLMEGYLALIDEIYKEDSGLNGDISIIALDTNEMTNLTDQEKQVLLVKMKAIYGMEILEGSYEELVEDGLIDGEKLYFPEGILITITNPNYDEKNERMTCEIKKWRGGLGAIGYNATAQYDGTVWNITKDNMWIS